MLSLGVDIGGTHVRAAVVDVSTGKLVAAAREDTGDHAPQAVADTVVSLVERVRQGHQVDGAAVGVGLAAMLHGHMVVNAPNFGWRDLRFGLMLEQKLGRRVSLVNDLSAAAWGELKAGAARGVQDSFTVFVGTGVGSAIVSGGRLLHGAHGIAGEFGHIKVVAEDGRPCGCGGRGCLEAYAGGARLTQWMKESGLEGTPAELEAAALKGDPVAKPIYDFAAGQLALAISNQVTMVNPAVVVLGGGVLEHCPGMVRRIQEVIRARTTAAALAGLRVEMAALGDDSGIVGAALLGADG